MSALPLFRSGVLSFLSMIMAALVSSAVAGDDVPHTQQLPPQAYNGYLEQHTVPLWEGDVPDARGEGFRDQPTLTIYPPGQKPNSTAVIIAPGGAYQVLSDNTEGRQIANWFNTRGVVAFVLKYRLGPEYPMPVPLEDAQRAMRWVRAHAGDFSIDPDRVGMAGFSAGGHLAALAGTRFDQGDASADDPVDRQRSQPDFLVLGYPALVMFSDPSSRIDYCQLMKIDQCDRTWRDRYRPERQVSADTPPTFIYQTTNDELVPPQGSIDFYTALVNARVPAELHIFGNGPHGSGLGMGDAALDSWTTLLDHWLRARGLYTPAEDAEH
ncbi:Acetyl esterase/lipase [Kushneria avicenniae]|uniref:Acetyl esterase/lipase n=1 Tax=Kushneria avicenniae TaxID=402385 RepID=A0A1I1KUH5_9GAMM|nr:alpha/beta hydrolase [Kushneria avicenniae]SFC64464.1 Acetyl esterase/lipase [Kushneria avicenniae]